MLSPARTGWRGAVVAVLLQAPLAWAGGDAPALPPDRAVQLALAAHPDLSQADAALATARAARSASAVLLSNPSGSAWASGDGSRLEIGLTQPVSLTGEGGHVRRSAQRSVVAAEASVGRQRLVIAAAVRQAYVDAVVATGVVDVAREGFELAARLRFAVMRKHEEGEASTLDLRLARLAEVQAAARLLDARRAQVSALRTLSGWTLEPVGPDALTDDPLSAAPSHPIDTQGERSDIRAAESQAESARAMVRRHRAATVPPVAVGVRVERERGDTFVGPAVQVTLPVFDRNQIGRAQAAGALEVAEGRLAQVRAVAQTEQATATVRLDEAESAAAVVLDADLDEARAALASIEAGVLAGEIELSAAVLLQAQVLQGEAAVVAVQGLLAGARIDRMLAHSDDALLGGAP